MPKKVTKRKILTRSFMTFMDNDLTTSAAAVSYFSMLAFFPTLLFVLALGARLSGSAQVEKYIISQVLTFFPGAQAFVRKNLESFSDASTSLIFSCFTVMLWAATWIFTVIEKALNRIWGTAPRSFLHGRAVNFAVMSTIFPLLITSSVLTATLTGLRAMASRLPVRLSQQLEMLSGYFWQSVFIFGSALITILLFTMLYKFLPNTRIAGREALTGAIVAGVLWEGAKFGFAYLLPYFHYDLLYGSIGAGIALLSWVYLSSVIMLFGAQFTALLHRDHLFTNGKPESEPTQEESPPALTS
ncbi:MAG: YihY/virulence factor BrkB family protein [Acidobacteria bacterium]|nr:YihY/virulence factor BrkB family protein [Acidobacteriota bacterium]